MSRIDLTAGQLVIIDGLDDELLSASMKLEDFATALTKGNGCPRGKAHRIARSLHDVVVMIDRAAEHLELL